MDTVAQLLVREVELGGFPNAPWMRVDGFRYGLGDSLRGRHGFRDDALLSERLLRIVTALALARRLSPVADDGWVSAEELAVTAEAGATPAATRQFLTRSLRGYTDHPEEEIEFVRVPPTHLVQYAPERKLRDSRIVRGRTRGPYRLRLPREAIVLDSDASLAFLGHSRFQQLGEPYRLEEAIPRAIALEACGEYLSARGIVVRSLVPPLDHPTRGLRERAATTYGYLAHINMQLGLSEESIRAARQARGLHHELGNSYGAACALRTQAQAESQLGTLSAALGTARQARTVFENARVQVRTPAVRSGFGAIVGQRQSHLHNFAAAERNFLNALRYAREMNDPLKVYTWTLRRAQNFHRQGRLGTAESTLSDAHDLAQRYAISGVERALLWRATAAFMVSTGRWDEAEQWSAHAMEYALNRRLRNEIQKLAPIRESVELHRGT